MNGFTGWWRTVGVLVGLELRQRTRATRWRVLLGVFFAFVSLVVFGSRWFSAQGNHGTPGDEWGTNLYFFVLGFVGFLGLVIAPTMTATSINGDRKDATLAVVQATPTSGLQLAMGKLLGAWIASCALLVVSAPYLAWAVAEAPYPVGRSLLGIGVVALIFLAYCGIGLGMSAFFSRPIGSAAVTQLTMLFLLVGLPVLAAALVPTTSEQVTYVTTDWDYDRTTGKSTCREVTATRDVAHTNRIWWIVAPNPAVVFADAASASDPGRDRTLDGSWADYRADDTPRPRETGLGGLADTVSTFRAGERTPLERRCVSDTPSRDTYYYGSYYDQDNSYVGRTWYWGLLANLALGGIGLAFAARRLRVPAANLPRGVRIA
ncbi:ABC transporter permease [Tsukamurella paurometabola]|uniref:ABC transporter permease n=1 Tax=Tsukamurella paurometabola TaxID=2061 RepID=A0ABS5N8K4_TSUPA|nr:ABC transporter permease [Tsukamurella paurometabola]MBS4100610.1 ABC transporter permease [Tsukamurella paurometabola]